MSANRSHRGAGVDVHLAPPPLLEGLSLGCVRPLLRTGPVQDRCIVWGGTCHRPGSSRGSIWSGRSWVVGDVPQGGRGPSGSDTSSGLMRLQEAGLRASRVARPVTGGSRLTTPIRCAHLRVLRRGGRESYRRLRLRPWRPPKQPSPRRLGHSRGSSEGSTRARPIDVKTTKTASPGAEIAQAAAAAEAHVSRKTCAFCGRVHPLRSGRLSFSGQA